MKEEKLTPKQRRNNIIASIVIASLFAAIVIHFSSENSRRSELLKDYAITTGKIIDRKYSGKGSDIYHDFIYEVSTKGFFKSSGGSSKHPFYKNEIFKIQYAKADPNIMKALYEEPVITNLSDYKESVATVTSKDVNPPEVTLQYIFNNKKYSRTLYLKSFKNLSVAKKVVILVNLENPKISYLKDNVSIEKPM